MESAHIPPHLAAFCPTDPACPHEAPHAGSHGRICRPAGAAGPVEPRRRGGPRWGRYGQADAELVAGLLDELRAHLRDLNRPSDPGDRDA